ARHGSGKCGCRLQTYQTKSLVRLDEEGGSTVCCSQEDSRQSPARQGLRLPRMRALPWPNRPGGAGAYRTLVLRGLCKERMRLPQGTRVAQFVSPCPLYPRKRTWFVRVLMSALCQ